MKKLLAPVIEEKFIVDQPAELVKCILLSGFTFFILL